MINKMDEMGYGRWNEWNGLWLVKRMGWTLGCEHSKEQVNNLNTTEAEYTSTNKMVEQDG